MEIINNREAVAIDRGSDDYQKLVDLINRSVSSNYETPLYLVEGENEYMLSMYDVFLGEIPSCARQEYDCHECRKYINYFGRLVYIDDKGNSHSCILNYTEDYLKQNLSGDMLDCALMLKRAAEARIIKEPYDETSNERPKTLHDGCSGGYLHFYGVPNILANHAGVIKRNHTNLMNLVDYCKKYTENEVKDAIAKTLDIVEMENLYQPFDFNEAAIILRESVIPHVYADFYTCNTFWDMASKLSSNICNIKTTVFWFLVDGILTREDQEKLVGEYRSMTSGVNYMRPKTAPSVTSIKLAAAEIEKLGYGSSMKRRFLNIDDIPSDRLIWRNGAIINKILHKDSNPVGDDSPFGDIYKKVYEKHPDVLASADGYSLSAPNIKDITMIGFMKLVKDRKPSEIVFIDGISRRSVNFCCLATASDPDAKPIMRWDTDEQRNPVSYYMYQDAKTADFFNINARKAHILGIVRYPNMWYDTDQHTGTPRDGLMFIVNGAIDGNYGNSGLGMFPDSIKPELYPIRRTIEYYSQNTRMENNENPTAAVALYFPINRGSVFATRFGININGQVYYYNITTFDDIEKDYLDGLYNK